MSLLRQIIYFFIFFVLSYTSHLYAQETINKTKTTSSILNPSPTSSSVQPSQPKTPLTQKQKNQITPKNKTTTSIQPPQPKAPLTQKQKNQITPQNKTTTSIQPPQPKAPLTQKQKNQITPQSTTTTSTQPPQPKAPLTQKQKNQITPQSTTTTSTQSPQPKAPLTQKQKNKMHIQKKINKLHQRLERRPNNFNLHFLLGKYYYLLDDFDKTIFHLKKNNKKPSIKALILLAKTYSQKENYQEEIRVLSILLEMHPDSPKIYTDIATAYYKSNKIEEAINYYKTALQKDIRYKAAYKGLWTVFESQKNFFDMKQIIEDFLGKFPNDIEAHSKLCQTNLKSRFADETMLSCNRAIKINPSYANNHVYLGLAHKWNGNDKQAEKIIFDTAKKFTKSILAQYEAGQLAEEKNLWNRALNFYRNCFKVDNRSFTCLMKTIYLEIKLQKYEEVTESFLTACRINKFKTFSEIRDTAGKLRIEKKMKWSHHFKALAERCHIVGDRRLEKDLYEPLTDLVVKKALPEEFEEAIIEEDEKEESLKSPSKTSKSKNADNKKEQSLPKK